jgi:hypothetical protein
MKLSETNEFRIKRPDLASEGASLQRSVSAELDWVRRSAKTGAFLKAGVFKVTRVVAKSDTAGEKMQVVKKNTVRRTKVARRAAAKAAS